MTGKILAVFVYLATERPLRRLLAQSVKKNQGRTPLGTEAIASNPKLERPRRIKTKEESLSYVA